MRRLLPLLLALAMTPAPAQTPPSPPTPATPTWHPVAPTGAARAIDHGLELRDGASVLRITAVAPHILRVRLIPGSVVPDEDRSFAVRHPLPEPTPVQRSGDATHSELRTAALRVRVQHQPLRLQFFDADGHLLDEDDPLRGTVRVGESARVWKRLRDTDHVYGLGEKTGRLDKRGWSLGGTHAVMWNSDTYGYDSSTDPLYVSIPFYLLLRDGRTHGVFLDNTHRSNFDIGREDRGLLSFGVEGGELNYYFIAGPHPREVVQRYTLLTGRMPLPPRWSLGYHQCRWSYWPESRVRLLADTFRSKRVPADAIWLDIDHLEGFKPFAWNREAFPDPARLIGDLRRQGLRLVTIVDAHPKKEPGYAPYDEGLRGGHFVKNPDGTVFEAPVWPANAAQNPGPSVFPDFTRAATRAWWGTLHKAYLDQGVAGIWNDMNEPAAFLEPAHTLPLDLVHANDGRPTTQREIHNVYGLLHTQATYEGLLALRPDERPFVLTRASFAGGQRYAAVWAGDNRSDWAALRQSLPTLMGLGLSGMPFVGTDIGGFNGVPSGELYTRWLQAAVFAPFMRAHTEAGTPDQEPWSYGHALEAVNRRTIELRYQLLPHLYNAMAEAAQSGLPALRPLVLEHPEDPATHTRDDEFLLGHDLLVAPVLHEGARERELYLPAGDWYPLGGGVAVPGGRSLRVPVDLDSLPVYVRAGAFVFRQPTVQHTGEMAQQPLQVQVYPGPDGERPFYEDDGESLAHTRGVHRWRRFGQQALPDGGLRLSVSAAEGRWQPAAGRALELSVMERAQPPADVRLHGAALPALDAAGWAAGRRGWTWEAASRRLRLRVDDAPQALEILLR